MYFKQSEYDERLNCLNCNKRFNIPKLLPCGESICETCLDELLRINSCSIKCPFCTDMHEVPTEENTFPSQNVLVDILDLKSFKVLKGDLCEKFSKKMQTIDEHIQRFFADLNLQEEKIKSHCETLRRSVDESDDDVNCSLTTKLKLFYEINTYETRCIQNLAKKSIQKEYIVEIFMQSRRKLAQLHDRFNYEKHDLLENEFNNLLVLENKLKNSRTFFNSLLFLGQRLVYNRIDDKTSLKQLKCEEFSYADILNIERLDETFQKSVLSYNEIFLNAKNEQINSIWLTLTSERIIISFFNYNTINSRNEIVIKLMDYHGQLLCQNHDNVNCDLITMNTDHNHIILAIKSAAVHVETVYQLHIYDLDLKLCRLKQLNYTPLLIHTTECFFYVFSTKAPFIHVLDKGLVERNAFGQDEDESVAFYMKNVMQIYVRDEKLYIRDCENVSIRVLDLYTGSLIKLIQINLIDCLFHIDLICRLIVVNTDSKILCIFNEDAEIVFEYDLTYVHTIASFCITNNGHLLINDTKNRVLHVI